MSALHDLARRWNWSAEELRDVQASLGLYTPPIVRDDPGHGKSEAWAQSVVMLEASENGVHLWRNNNGALPDKTGRIVRYGLANESKAVNERIKSADLIGCRPRVIEPWMVGHLFGQFVSREMKEPGWQFNPDDPHEAAQLAWANLILSLGGDAAFATGRGTL